MKDHRKERAEARKKAEKLVSQMTLLEKASQLKYDAAPVKRLGVPAYNYWNEALHGVARAGVATMFPQAIAMAAVFDDEEMKKVGDIIATEGRAKYNAYSAKEDRDIYKGLTFWSPNVNIFRDPRWGRGHETYGEDPYLTSRLGVKFVEGIQGDGPVMKAAACAKHYAVHSGPESLRHEFDAQASMKDMWETYLPAFEALVTEADVEAELNSIVDMGGWVKDVFVYHKVYGVIKADLNLHSRRDIKDYMEEIGNGKSNLLMNVTSGYHYHTVIAPDEDTLDIIQEKLDKLGFLARLQEYEPVDFWSSKA